MGSIAKRAGRYVVSEKIAAGGMAAVYLAQLRGPVGFARVVAVKRLHAHFAGDAEFVAMLMDEARLAARIRHPNVVPTLDVVAEDGELFLVMEYVPGESLAKLVKAAKERSERIPVKIAVTLIAETLHGLHAAHEATSETGKALDIVHRDVSPQNVLVGVDGVPRVLDFGIAKASSRSHSTQDGAVKGKAGYMAPEQIEGDDVDRRTDVYAASVVLWELLAGKRLFTGDTPMRIMKAVLDAKIEPPSTVAENVSPELDAIVMRGLRSDRSERFATAREMAIALEALLDPARKNEIGEWVERLAHDGLTERREIVARCESLAQPREKDRVESESASQVMTLVGDAAKERDEPEGTSSSTKLDRPKSFGARVAVPIALVGFGGAALFFAYHTANHGGAITPPASATVASAIAIPSSTLAAPTASTSASSTTTTAAPVVPSSTPSSHPQPSHKPKSGKNAAPQIDCTIPYYVDSEGVRHPRDECAK